MTARIFTACISCAGLMLRLRRDEGAMAIAYAWPTAEMRDSYSKQRPAWDALLGRTEVRLVCYCTDPMHCHRAVLAEILGKLGATVLDEHVEAADDRGQRRDHSTAHIDRVVGAPSAVGMGRHVERAVPR